MVYGVIGALVVISLLGIALRIQTSRLEAVKQEYEAFQAQVKALGDVAEAKNRAKEKADKALTEKIDHENKTLRTNLAVAAKRLRDASAGSGRVPQIPAPAGGAGEATIDLAIANRALSEYFTAARRLDLEVAEIIVSGAEATADLDSSKVWALRVKDQSAVK